VPLAGGLGEARDLPVGKPEAVALAGGEAERGPDAAGGASQEDEAAIRQG
jgi:hypothetical protein